MTVTILQEFTVWLTCATRNYPSSSMWNVELLMSQIMGGLGEF